MFPEGPTAPAGVPTVVYAGNMASYQGIEMLLEAFAGAARRHTGLRLRIVTDESFEPYEAQARSLGIRERVELACSSLEKLPSELATAHVAVNPRVACDGLPQKLLNYMAAACPIVSFEGSARHLVHYENALVVPDGDVGAMSEALLKLVWEQELAQGLGRNAQQHVRSQMSWQHAAASVEQVYARVTGGHR